MKTAEEILEDVFKECNIENVSVRFKSCMALAMEDYASQSQAVTPREPEATDVKNYEICNGAINTNGLCTKCYATSQNTSAYCQRLIETTYHPESSQSQLKELPSDDCDNCSKAPYNEKGYPQEFIEWIGLEGVELRYYDEIPKWIHYKRNTIEPLVKFNTLPELYTYWQNEINK